MEGCVTIFLSLSFCFPYNTSRIFARLSLSFRSSHAPCYFISFAFTRRLPFPRLAGARAATIVERLPHKGIARSYTCIPSFFSPDLRTGHERTILMTILFPLIDSARVGNVLIRYHISKMCMFPILLQKCINLRQQVRCVNTFINCFLY